MVPQLNNALLLAALSTSRRDWWQGEEIADLEHPTARILGGVPNLDWLNMPGWYGREDGSHLDLAPVTPLTGRDSLRVRDLLKKPAHRGTRPRRAVVCRPAMGLPTVDAGRGVPHCRTRVSASARRVTVATTGAACPPGNATHREQTGGR
jgi:hypothetical protein